MTTTTTQQKGHFSRNWLFYLLLTIATGLCTYFWVSTKWALVKQLEAFEEERNLLLRDAQTVFRINTEQHLELMAKTFAWAIRSEMNRGNQEQVEQYFKQLVRSKKIQEVTLIGEKGRVRVSTNKKLEGRAFVAPYREDILEIEKTTILEEGDELVVAAPIMGFDAQLGTLLIICKNDAFDFDSLMDKLETDYDNIIDETDTVYEAEESKRFLGDKLDGIDR